MAIFRASAGSCKFPVSESLRVRRRDSLWRRAGKRGEPLARVGPAVHLASTLPLDWLLKLETRTPSMTGEGGHTVAAM